MPWASKMETIFGPEMDAKPVPFWTRNRFGNGEKMDATQIPLWTRNRRVGIQEGTRDNGRALRRTGTKQRNFLHRTLRLSVASHRTAPRSSSVPQHGLKAPDARSPNPDELPLQAPQVTEAALDACGRSWSCRVSHPKDVVWELWILLQAAPPRGA